MALNKPTTANSDNGSSKSQSMCLKLLVDRKSKRVIFAEAGKDTVDFLFHLLQMPAGTIIQLLSPTNMAGSIGNIFQSMSNLDNRYLQSIQNKDAILNTCNAKVGLLTNGEDGDQPTEPEIAKKHYTCNYYHYYSERYKAICSSCKGSMMHELKRNPSDIQSNVNTNVGVKSGVGIVKELVTYMVMDDLTIMPMSTVSGLTQLSKNGVKDTSVLEEQVVPIGMDQGLALLKASFESKTVLTDVFLSNKKAKKKR